MNRCPDCKGSLALWSEHHEWCPCLRPPLPARPDPNLIVVTDYSGVVRMPELEAAEKIRMAVEQGRSYVVLEAVWKRRTGWRWLLDLLRNDRPRYVPTDVEVLGG